MNKKLITLAVAGVLAVPAAAFAQASNVQIYGRLNLGLDNYSATGATIGSAGDYKARNRVYDAGSRLGFTGSEDLGNGLKAIFLLESGINVDNGGTTGQGGQANPYTGTLSSRIGYVGLQGTWGRLTFGKDNVWWGNTPIERSGADYIAAGIPSFNGLLGRGMNVGVTRVSNLVQYIAQASGVTGILSYSAGGETAAAGANTSGRLWGATVQGQWGAFGAGYDWVNLKGNAPTSGAATAASTGHKARAGWTYAPGSQISVLWIKSIQDNLGYSAIALAGTALAPLAALSVPDATAASLSQTSWGLSWEHTFGNFQGMGQWSKVNNITGCAIAGACDNTNATAWMAGLRYNFSKRTGVYVNYATIKNASNYNMDYLGGWMTSASTTSSLPGLSPATVPAFGIVNSNGADPRIVGVGMMHTF